MQQQIIMAYQETKRSSMFIPSDHKMCGCLFGATENIFTVSKDCFHSFITNIFTSCLRSTCKSRKVSDKWVKCSVNCLRNFRLIYYKSSLFYTTKCLEVLLKQNQILFNKIHWQQIRDLEENHFAVNFIYITGPLCL